MAQPAFKISSAPTMPKRSRILYYLTAAAILLGISPALVWGSLFK